MTSVHHIHALRLCFEVSKVRWGTQNQEEWYDAFIPAVYVCIP